MRCGTGTEKASTRIALGRKAGTGSHIPFDRKAIKFNKSSGEVLKDDEVGILEAVARIREAEYRSPGEDSLFDDDGMFKEGESPSLPPVNEEGAEAYLGRYLGFFEAGGLAGQRFVFCQHTAVVATSSPISSSGSEPK